MPLYFTQEKGGKKLKIKQSASEMLCLIRYLGFMIGDLIPAGNRPWKLYQYLRRAVGIITCPKIDVGDINDLKILISKHNSLYLELYGALKPKMHFWVHYQTLILKNGSVKHISSFMFERKNRKMKEIAVATSSNVNVSLTIAIRRQLQLCYMKGFCSNIENDIVLGPIDNSNAQAEFLKLIPNLNRELSVETIKHIEIVNYNFSEGTIFVTRFDDEKPHFGKVKQKFSRSKYRLFRNRGMRNSIF